MVRQVLAFTALPLLMGTAVAQERQAAPVAKQPRLEGVWRVEPSPGVSRSAGGRIQFWRDDQGRLRYERRTRPRTTGAVHIERGLALLKDNTLWTHGRSITPETGLTQQLVGRGAPQESPPPTLARYAVQEQGPWSGRRRESDQSVGSEQIRRAERSDLNDVRLLIDGTEAFPAIFEALESAQHSIEVETYVWADDETGRRIGEILMKKAREGVRVRCLVDEASALTNSGVSAFFKRPKRDFMGTLYKWGLPVDKSHGLDDELRDAGAQVITRNGLLAGAGQSILHLGRKFLDIFRTTPREPKERKGILNHDHRKIIVVDNLVAFCGGMNLALEYEIDMHDVHSRVEGPAAHDLHLLFAERWQEAGGEGTPDPAPRVAWQGDASVKVVGDLPGLHSQILDQYLHEIETAEKLICLEIAYFLDDRIIDGLEAAIARGVRVILIVPGEEKNDVIPVREAFAHIQNEIIRAGIELYYYDSAVLHSKVGSFDGLRATVGSANLDAIALEYVSEANLFVTDPRFAREINSRLIQADMSRSTRGELRDDPWHRRMVTGLFHFFRRFL